MAEDQCVFDILVLHPQDFGEWALRDLYGDDRAHRVCTVAVGYLRTVVERKEKPLCLLCDAIPDDQPAAMACAIPQGPPSAAVVSPLCAACCNKDAEAIDKLAKRLGARELSPGSEGLH